MTSVPLYSLTLANVPWNKATLYLVACGVIGDDGRALILPEVAEESSVSSMLKYEKPTLFIMNDWDSVRIVRLGKLSVDEINEGCLISFWFLSWLPWNIIVGAIIVRFSINFLYNVRP